MIQGPRYQLCTHGPWWAKPYYVAVKVEQGNFWQQISPSYIRRGNAIRYARKHNIKLENP